MWFPQSVAASQRHLSPLRREGRELRWTSVDSKKLGALPLPRRSGERWLGEAETEWGSTSAGLNKAWPSCHARYGQRPAAWKCVHAVASGGARDGSAKQRRSGGSPLQNPKPLKIRHKRANAGVSLW